MVGKAQTEPSKGTKQATLMGYFGKPKPGPAIPRPPPSTATNSKAVPPVATSSHSAPAPSTSSPASTALRTPSSALGSSPTTVVARTRVRSNSPLKNVINHQDDFSDDLTPPPLEQRPAAKLREEQAQTTDEEMNGAAGEDSPIVLSRRTKRKVVYAESETESEAEVNGSSTMTLAPAKPATKRKNDSDSDDYMLDDDDDTIMASILSASPPPTSKPAKKRKSTSGFIAPASVPQTSRPAPSRPPAQPLASSSRLNSSTLNSSHPSSRGGSEEWLHTRAETRKADDKEKRGSHEQVFSFLENVLDAQERAPDHPDYDKRTLFIPETAWDKMTAFEKQFWWIKKDFYDTVLFFQKGYFYELYEDDAAIGHREFDLKLTNRVKMKMVGVPEQQFEIWAAKFLAAGYKVGKVNQQETAIGMDMRKQREELKKTRERDSSGMQVKPDELPKRKTFGKPNEKLGEKDKIVNRELSEVFTNGTIVDGVYLSSDDSNHCVAIKESLDPATGLSNFGVCILDASTGAFDMAYLEDDVVNSNLETLFRQIRPKELLHAKNNLSVHTQRVLRRILPASTLWESFTNVEQFYTYDVTLQLLAKDYQLATDPDNCGKPTLPDSIQQMMERPLAIEALGGMMFYIKTLNLDQDLLSQKNFNIYDPIRQGKSMILDGQTLSHMEVLMNNEGGEDGTLLQLLQLCGSPFGKRLFRHWLMSPLRDAKMINERLDAVEELLRDPALTGVFTSSAKKLPDLERLISRAHAGALKQRDFHRVIEALGLIQDTIDNLSSMINPSTAKTIHGLLRGFPDISQQVQSFETKYRAVTEKSTFEIVPQGGGDAQCVEAQERIDQIEADLRDYKDREQKALRLPPGEIKFWHSAQGGKEIYQLEIAAKTVPRGDWLKQSGTKAVSRYYSPELKGLVRQLLEAREDFAAAKQGFYGRLLTEFDEDRELWLKAVKVVAELDCLVSLAHASHNLDEPKCRPTFVESPVAFVDFQELRHPSMCLRSQFIPNDVQLGGNVPRTTLLTGPNMAGKSTLLRMTAAAIIMAQIGCYVPAAKAVLSPVDKIQTRMGAYDNMFAAASTFKVEMDECSRILREAGPRSFVVLDELGRGTSTFDGMAIAGAVLHQLSTHTLPLGFFATHYGTLTDDYAYHPNIRNMHMMTNVDDERRQVVFLYKLIPGVAESSHGTHVAALAKVPTPVVSRADQVSAEFKDAFNAKLATRRQSSMAVEGRSDAVWLLKIGLSDKDPKDDGRTHEGRVLEFNTVQAAVATWT